MKLNLCAGTHITSNIWKMRWKKLGSGKSGGLRVYYFDYKDIEHTFLITIFGKNEKDNLNEAETKLLAKIVEEIKNG